MVITFVILHILFFMVCYMATGDDKKNIKNFYVYSDEIQTLLKEDESLKEFIPKKPSKIISFIVNLIIFTSIFIIVGIILKISNLKESFIYFFILGESLNLFDLIFIDMFWWRKTKRIRFTKIQEDKKYKEIKYHMIAFKNGIILFLLVAIFSSIILNYMLKYILKI